MRIGAHVSASSGLQHSVARAVDIGAECAQLFVGAPQRWFSGKFTEEELLEYRRVAEDAGVGPNVVHAPYLVNLAAPDPLLRKRSIGALVNQMHFCERMGIMGLIVHVGSEKGSEGHDDAMLRVITGMEEILARSSTVMFLVENTAGMGTTIGSSFEDIGEIFDRLGRDARLGVCLDTAHTFEAGFDITTRAGLDEVLERFDRAIGLDRLRAIHANDSKTAFGSNVDRHANIGEGFLGEDGLGNFMTHPAMRDLSFYLEVPGFAGRGPDRENIDILRRLAGLPALPPAPATESALTAADPPGLD
jgi:deoxyribonuclease-4